MAGDPDGGGVGVGRAVGFGQGPLDGSLLGAGSTAAGVGDASADALGAAVIAGDAETAGAADGAALAAAVTAGLGESAAAGTARSSSDTSTRNASSPTAARRLRCDAIT